MILLLIYAALSLLFIYYHKKKLLAALCHFVQKSSLAINSTINHGMKQRALFQGNK